VQRSPWHAYRAAPAQERGQEGRLDRVKLTTPPPQPSQPPQASGISPFWILRTLGKCWGSSALKEMVFAELKNRNNSLAQFESLLEPLLTADFAPARDFAAVRLTTRRLRSTNHRPYAFAAATQLAAHSSGSCWPLIWQHVLNDQQFGVDLFLKLAHEYRHDNLFLSAGPIRTLTMQDASIWSGSMHHAPLPPQDLSRTGSGDSWRCPGPIVPHTVLGHASLTTISLQSQRAEAAPSWLGLANSSTRIAPVPRCR
jgi:hypothetical protein